VGFICVESKEVAWMMLQRQGFWLALPMFCWPKITRKIALSLWTGPLPDSSIILLYMILLLLAIV